MNFAMYPCNGTGSWNAENLLSFSRSGLLRKRQTRESDKKKYK